MNKNTIQKLYSQTKDGPPKNILQKIIGYGYPIVLLLIAIINTIGIFRLKNKWNWKTFSVIFIICSVTGWFWGIFIEKYDPNFPGWLFLPWSILNVEFILTLEDWLFYPFCTILFYIIFKTLKENKSQSNEIVKIIVTLFHIIITCFFCYFTSVCGKSLSYQCAIPALIMFFYIWDIWDVKHYLKFISIVIILEVIWDYVAVSLLSYIPGMAWASQWVYIAFDLNGNYIHSKVFLDYGTHRWAWIFRNPIEITPWFAISVGMYFYSMIIAFEKMTRSR